MTNNSGSSPQPPKLGQKHKLTVAQGVIGAATLAGTTAIPILVQRALTPASVSSPSPAASVQPSPTPTVSVQSSPAQVQTPNAQDPPPPMDEKKGKKKKSKKD